jgi:hypothetical protein
MIGKSHLFCHSLEKGYIKEESALYFILPKLDD